MNSAFAIDVTPLKTLPVLDHGRIKPIDTVARESIQFITGCIAFGTVKTDANGHQDVVDKRDPLDSMLDFAAHPVAWQTQPVLYVPLLDLRARLHMKDSEQWISPRAVMENTEFNTWVHGIEDAKRQAEMNKETVFTATESEGTLNDAAVELDERLQMFEAAIDLRLYCFLPVFEPDAKPDPVPWLPIAALLSLSPENAQAGKPMLNAWANLMDSYKSGDESGFASAAADLQKQVLPFVSDTASDTAKAIAAGQLPEDTIAELHEDARLLADYSNTSRLNRELFYNKFQPFYWTWALYIVALSALILSLMWKKTVVYVAAMSLLAISILFHAFGFVLRCSITGWAPVTNMYETIIWVAMMGAVFAFVLEMVYRHRVIAIGGAVVALLGTIVAASMPPEFGTSIRGLQPVLRSNYWLGIHVLTIVSSYAAFALAMVLGNIVLGQFINGKVAAATIRTNIFYTYRAIQIGVLLVAAGTILGGLWADVSWGKFWSWDAKEVWALIVLLTYLALLHGRFAGWIKQFGLAAGAVLCFSAVLMSWYGVNFVLRAGLHAYGFGSGGQGYMFTFVGLQWVYVITAWLIYKGRHSAPPAAEQVEIPNALPVTGK